MRILCRDTCVTPMGLVYFSAYSYQGITPLGFARPNAYGLSLQKCQLMTPWSQSDYYCRTFQALYNFSLLNPKGMSLLWLSEPPEIINP